MLEPFSVAWPKEQIDQLRQRIRAYEFPKIIGADDWRFGCKPSFLRDLCRYWINGFDADAAAAVLNRYPQFRTRIDDIDLHFIHVVGEAQGKRPLLLVHGWPGSIFEFWLLPR